MKPRSFGSDVRTETWNGSVIRSQPLRRSGGRCLVLPASLVSAIALLIDVLKNTNALSMLTLIVLASLPNQADIVLIVPELQSAFADVLPALEPLPASV